MIGYLFGEIVEHSEGKMLISIGDRTGGGVVGYSVSVPKSHTYDALLPGQKIELFIYTHVREDAFDLFGFHSKVEKILFLTLLGVSGIGPKGALGILSGADVGQLVEAIIRDDQAFLTRLPGVGKKTAERVIVELRDLLKKKVDTGVFAMPGRSATNATSSTLSSGEKSVTIESSIFQDAKSALVGLGYREQDIQQILNRALEKLDVPPKRAEDLIKSALRQLI